MALENIRVVEMGQAFAGPWSAEILANLGADVIKVERPGSGDETRRWGPPFWGKDAAVFHAVNSNKKSVTLDLKDEKGREDFLTLVSGADIFLHNMRPGVLDKMGLGFTDLLGQGERMAAQLPVRSRKLCLFQFQQTFCSKARTPFFCKFAGKAHA